MEELFAYALLYVIGYDKSDEYNRTLDRLFLAEPTNEEFLDLEGMRMKDAMLHLLHLMKSKPFDSDKLGSFLMRLLKSFYQECDIHDFAEIINKLWYFLPSGMEQKEPFYTFSYAGECLICSSEESCREMCERALNYYEK